MPVLQREQQAGEHVLREVVELDELGERDALRPVHFELPLADAHALLAEAGNGHSRLLVVDVAGVDA